MKTIISVKNLKVKAVKDFSSREIDFPDFG